MIGKEYSSFFIFLLFPLGNCYTITKDLSAKNVRHGTLSNLKRTLKFNREKLMKTLFLGSKSESRKMLLTQAHIPFVIVEQEADEAQCDWNLPLEQAVASIAAHKMNHVILPKGAQGDVCFVLTADTLSIDANGKLNGKPMDRQDAIKKIQLNRRRSNRLATAFCLEKRLYKNNAWVAERRIERVVGASYIFDIPDDWIDIYFEKTIALKASGAVAVEEYGTQFLQAIEGSYSTIIGLPMFELREALTELGFFEHQKSA